MPDSLYNDDGTLKDGARLRIPMLTMDAKHYGLYPLNTSSKEGDSCVIDGRPGHLKRVEGGYLCLPDKASDSIATNMPVHVVDASGMDDALAMSRPGPRYLHAGHATADHVLIATYAALRDEARREADEQPIDPRRTVARIHHDGINEVENAYLDSVEDLRTSWQRTR